MKIVFWSPCAGKCATSSSMAAIATFYSLVGEDRCCMLPAAFGNRGIQNAFISKEGDDSLKQTMGSFGVDALLLRSPGNFFDLSDSALSIHGKLELFPVSTSTRVNAAEAGLTEVYMELIEALDKEYGTCFVDAGSGYSPLVEKAVLTADLLAVCVPQSVDALDRLEQLCDLSSVSTVYLLTNYDKDVQLNKIGVCKQCKSVAGKDVFVLPHCAEFADAMNNSSLLKWLKVNKESNNKTLLEMIGAKSCNSRKEFFAALNTISKEFLKRGGKK